MKELGLMPTGSKFSFNGKIYVILLREWNMSEVKDQTGKRWAWPSSAKVHAITAYHERENYL